MGDLFDKSIFRFLYFALFFILIELIFNSFGLVKGFSLPEKIALLLLLSAFLTLLLHIFNKKDSSTANRVGYSIITIIAFSLLAVAVHLIL
jgi:hypothetical protein